MEGGKLVAELAQRLTGKAVISSEIKDEDIKEIGVESLTAQALSYFEKSSGLNILDRATLSKILEREKESKSPVQIEVIQKRDFNPTAKDIASDFSIRNAPLEKTPARVEDFAVYFNNRFEKIKAAIERGRGGGLGIINSMENLKQYANGRDVGVIGMVYDKIITKKGHILVTLEDGTGQAKVLFIRPEKTSRKEMHELFEFASRLVSDEVVAIRGRVSSPFLMASAVIWPDIPIRQMKKAEEDFSIAFTSDIHVGSKLFMEKQFVKFIEWLNGNVDARRDIAEKIKYLVIAGDLVDGIGVYPNQDRELSISDIYKQYAVFFDYLGNVPDHIEIFVLAGNHDALHRAEPQPPLGDELMQDFKRDNIHVASNPSYITLHGIKTLAYHGTSLNSVIQSIPSLSNSRPEAAMVELLKKRHLSPIYGDNPIMPSKEDSLVMDVVPDILHMGHMHRNGYTEYHGTQVINSGTWQSKTSYQTKQGHIPTPCILPIYNAKSGELWSMDFNAVS
ncbi:MAG TPA: DNA-directed DNA polymerase II small subunit [Candidatus Saccharimonadales bacterium]|nr:DNA-directed DNA polymerase II small subunit [Candidatus Saccharimonadales bacterium]